MWFISKHNSRSDPSGQIIISSDQWDHVLLIMGWLVGEIEEWISITSILYMDIISTCYKSECGGTVVQQVWFEQPRDRLSEVVDCHLALKEISNKNDHLSQFETKNQFKSHKCIRGEPPVLFLIVMIDPPPIPMLWGLTTELHRRAAMAPSTAEPPCCSIFLENSHLISEVVWSRRHRRQLTEQ